MQAKKLTLAQAVAAAGVFSAISFWYGFMFGRESARRELGGIIDDLRCSSSNPTATSTAPPTPTLIPNPSLILLCNVKNKNGCPPSMTRLAIRRVYRGEHCQIKI